MVMTVETANFWDMTLCGLIESYQHFGETFCFQEMGVADYFKLLVTLYHTTGHVYTPRLQVACEENYGKK
jgi:hypothetical protein